MSNNLKTVEKDSLENRISSLEKSFEALDRHKLHVETLTKSLGTLAFKSSLDTLTSESGDFCFVMQSDSNVVCYKRGDPIFSLNETLAKIK